MPRISLENIVDLSHIGIGPFPAFFGPYSDSSYKIHYRAWIDPGWYELYVDSETNWFIVRYSWDGHVRYFKADTKDWDDIDGYWLASFFDLVPFDYYYNVF